MSKNYSTSTTFHQNDTRIRDIVQEELEEFFYNIKSEIETKIKQIDRNIHELKKDIDLLLDWRKECDTSQIKQISGRIEEVEERVRELMQFREGQIEKNEEFSSLFKNRAGSKEKGLLFKTTPMLNLNTVVFGEDSENIQHNYQKKAHERINQKPPLPQNSSKKKYKLDLNPSMQYTSPEETSIPESEPVHQNNPFIQNRNSNIESETNPRENRLVGELNKNKNTFLRKKSQKKIYTIQEESVQQSIMSNKS